MSVRMALSAVLVVTLGTGAALAQQMRTVEGLVTDNTGAVLPGVRIEARSGEQSVVAGVTEADGRYRIEIEDGRFYELSAQVEGFSERVVRIDSSVATVQDFKLGIAPLADSIVVTPSGTERRLASTTESLTVFTSDDIVELGSHSVADVLSQVPGLDVGATGREGGVSSLFSRGGEADYNHVLIDGVRVNTNGGQFDFGPVSAAEIDRIEVVRGAQSARYGSDAIGSVVQMFTKRGSRSGGPQVSGSLEGGSFQTFRGDVRVLGGALDSLDYQFGVTQRSTNGAFGDLLPEKDEFDQTTVDGNFGVYLNERAAVRTGVRYSDAKGRVVGAIDYAPGDTGQIADTEDLSWYANVEGMLTSSVSYRADVNIFRYDAFQEDTIADPFPNLYTILEGTPGALFPERPRLVRTVTEAEFKNLLADSGALGPGEFLASSPFGVFFGDFPFELAESFRRYDIGYQVDATWMETQVLSAGYEYVEEKDPADALFQIDNHAFFVQQQFTLGQWFVTTGVRVDDNSRFGTEVSPKLSAGGFPVQFRSGPVSSVKIFVNAGRGIKNPTFAELFPSAFSDGNLALEPERARTLDAGAELTFDDQRWMGRITMFDNSFEDQVAFLSSSPSFIASYRMAFPTI